MDAERRAPSAAVGWSITALGAGCFIAAANWSNNWRSHGAYLPPTNLSVTQARDRMEFWLAWTALAAVGAAVAWALRRRTRPRPDDDVGDYPDVEQSPVRAASAAQMAAATSDGATAIWTQQQAQDPPTHRVDWRVPTAPRPLHWVDAARWALGLGWVALAATALLAGARPAPYEQLLVGVRAGTVTQVTVAGALVPAPGSDPGSSTGSVTQDITWRQGWAHHRAEVIWAQESVTVGATSDGRPVPVVRQDVAQVLTAAAPDGLVVDRADRVRLTSAQFLGWYLPLPQVMAPVLLAGVLLTLFVVLNMPPPWRLTRWAWFWVGFTPVGALLLSVFAGPTPGVPVPRRAQQRIGGLVGLVVSLLAAPLLHWGSR